MTRFGISYWILILLSIASIPSAFACSTHGSPDIGIPEITPLGGDMWELRFSDFTTLEYTPGEMCSCGIQVLNDWDIQSAKIVLAGTNTLVSTFPIFIPDSILSTTLESSIPTSPESKWAVLKNTITVSSSGEQEVDLIFTGKFPGTSKLEIIQEMEGKRLSAGKVNNQGTDFVPDHFHVFTIINEIIGGKMITIDSTSLLLVNFQNVIWLISLLSTTGIGLFLWIRK